MSEVRKKYMILHVDGGMGKNIMATAVAEVLKKNYPDYELVVVTAWDAPWYLNPNVYRVYNFGQMPYFYDEFVFDDTKIFRIDPYHAEDYILKKKHLLQVWCETYGLEYNGEMPKLYLNPREIELVKDKIKPEQGKPILLMQTHGGAPNQYSEKSWARDMPVEIAKGLINYFSKNYRILHIRREDQPEFQGVESLILPHRELYAAFLLSSKRLFIDSFSQHAAKALGLDSVVCWIANDPKMLGYESNINIRPNAEIVNELNKFSYLEQYDITGQVQQFPYDTVNLFDINEIAKAVNKL
jgi:hypothetical protein